MNIVPKDHSTPSLMQNKGIESSEVALGHAQLIYAEYQVEEARQVQLVVLILAYVSVDRQISSLSLSLSS
jgi:hypothetical protein